MHARGAERIDRHRRAKRRVDAAREAQHHAGEAVVVDIVAKAHHAGRVIGLVALLDRLERTLDAAPALFTPLPHGARDHWPKGGQLHREAAVGIEREGRALEHQFVLPADHVEVDQRQAALDHAIDRDVLADRQLVALVRRGVGDEQDLAAGLENAFDWVGSPDVLADRHPDAHALKDDRAGRGAGHEHPLFVEDAVIRQVDLEPHRLDPATGQERHRIVQPAVLDPWQANQRGRPSVRRLPRQLLQSRAARLLEGRLQDEVFRRIAGEEEFRRQHEVGPERRSLGARLAQPVAVARDVADNRGNLRERDDEAVGGRRHGEDLARAGRQGQLSRGALPSPVRERAGDEGSGGEIRPRPC